MTCPNFTPPPTRGGGAPKALILAAATLALLLHGARAEPPSSVLVETQVPQQGSLPDRIETYGSAAPALDGGMTLSLQLDGRVAAIAVTPGETVHAGQRLVDVGASPAAVSTYQQAVTALTLARTERAHVAQLLTQQLATRDQLAQADKTVADAQATFDALRREGADHAVQTLAAPFDGIVATIPVAPGDHVQPGTPLATLTRLDGLVVTVGIEPGDRDRVRPAQPAHLERLAAGPALDGRVLRVDGMLNAKTRLVDADVSVPPGTVISGEAFRVAITVGQLQGWVVPHDAVLADDSGASVFQVKDGKAVRVPVRMLGSTGDSDVVDGPIDAALKLVVQGSYQLADGAAVREGSSQAAQR